MLEATMFVFAALTAVFLLLAVTAERPVTARGRLEALRDRGAFEAPAVTRTADTPFSERIVRPALKSLSGLAEKVGLATDARLVQEKLEMAGRPRMFGSVIGVREYVAMKFIAIVLAVALFAVLWRHPVVEGIEGLLLSALLAIIVGMAPTLVIDRMVDNRKRVIQRTMSDVLDLLVVSSEAGLSLDAAMGRVAQKRRGPLPEEFEYALQEMRLGKSRADALRGIARRTGVIEVKMFTSSLIQAELLGVSIAQVLRTQADSQRERRSQRIREAAAKLPVKILFPIVLFIMPALFVVLAGPGIMSLLRVMSSATR
jgi:tight adherence protein C